MAALKKAFEAMGFRDVRTVLASGNIIKVGSIGFLTGIILFLLIFGGTLSAQVKTVDISGWVTDIYGDILSDVNITLSGPQITSMTTKTGPTGMYMFRAIPPGTEYKITAELTGYRKVAKTGIIVQVGSRTTIELTLENLIVSKWSAGKTAFRRFMEEPSPSTSSEFYLSISNSQGIDDDKTEILDYIFGRFTGMGSIGRYRIISTEMLNGDLYAARVAIKLLGFIDKGWQKPRGQTFFVGLKVGASLGELIRVNPALFLRACYEERHDPFLQQKGFPVNYVPFILHMKKTMVSYEMEMRKEALLSVEDPDLRDLRGLCIDIIEKGTLLFEAFATERPVPGEPEGRRLSESEEAVKNVLSEMMSLPSPENMRKVIDLFDERREGFSYVISAVLPLMVSEDEGWPPRSLSGPDPLTFILHEAECGNEAAIDVAFSVLFYAWRCGDDLAIQSIHRVIGNLILSRPALFIEKASKNPYLEAARPDIAFVKKAAETPLLDAERPVTAVAKPTILELLCGQIDSADYLKIAENALLRRRIKALAALNMPEHQELIDRCIRLIKKHLK
jgi:hypothetical protein